MTTDIQLEQRSAKIANDIMKALTSSSAHPDCWAVVINEQIKSALCEARTDGIREAADRLKREADALEPHSHTSAMITRSAEKWVRALISGQENQDAKV